MSNFDNSLTRLPPKTFELTIIPYYKFIADLLNDFLGHRVLDAITYNAEKAFISQKCSRNLEILRECLKL